MSVVSCQFLIFPLATDHWLITNDQLFTLSVAEGLMTNDQ
ncbi:hypothetical protein NSP_47590 [Nodularia spumigena CCY9414]|nr:hypothetical protein NSP_47590 [Nodularia spumigena CCY9414]